MSITLKCNWILKVKENTKLYDVMENYCASKHRYRTKTCKSTSQHHPRLDWILHQTFYSFLLSYQCYRCYLLHSFYHVNERRKTWRYKSSEENGDGVGVKKMNEGKNKINYGRWGVWLVGGDEKRKIIKRERVFFSVKMEWICHVALFYLLNFF